MITIMPTRKHTSVESSKTIFETVRSLSLSSREMNFQERPTHNDNVSLSTIAGD